MLRAPLILEKTLVAVNKNSKTGAVEFDLVVSKISEQDEIMICNTASSENVSKIKFKLNCY